MKRLAMGLGLTALVALPLSAQAPSPAPVDLRSALQHMHADYVEAFVVSEGFGESRLTPMMRLRWSYDPVGDSKLRIGDVQLIGIARHDPPVVYSSVFKGFEHGENGPELVDKSARETNAGEAQALLALASGEEIVFTPESGGLRVIGPIRARSQCLDCHRGKQAGELLGALSYRLEPAQLEDERR
ncbi:hypothetical protein [Pseudoxanthomonas sacheonensis]|uniref:hypothetical protein n=1 Tax=Pseudoxanthomonas sacheonensis TaxID=443615 RepID=UPI0013D5C3E4|nr:hypothetical protein [Pseudoxanthomonas sacheonensis]KAF1712926.1 hypothetical protein CSC73_01175 [Pseudoxanthomonas sacheonensis]